MTNHTNAVDVENKIELLWPIESGSICDENQTRQWRDRLCRSIYAQTETQLLEPIWLDVVYAERKLNCHDW